MNSNGKVKLTVTGGAGFIARGVLESCARIGLSCRALSRSTRPSWAGQAVQWSTVPAYDDMSALRQALAGTKYLLHLADNPVRNDARDAGMAVRNCDALIEVARSVSVEGIVVASSVYAGGALGDGASSYGSVKRVIELKFLSASDIRTIVLRLPPVYGPGGRGGFAALSNLVRKELPLPLAMAVAPRAYLSRRNLVSLIIAMVNAGDENWEKAANRIFEPSDGRAVSTRDLIRDMAAQIGVASRLLPVPLVVLRALGAVTGRSEMIGGAIERLDVAPVEELEAAFGWRPIERMPESLAFLRDEVRSS